MTSRSEPYKIVDRPDPMTFPLVEEITHPPYSDYDKPTNDKPHQVYCEACQYRTIVTGLAGPRCGTCKRYLITIVQRNELAQPVNVSTSGT